MALIVEKTFKTHLKKLYKDCVENLLKRQLHLSEDFNKDYKSMLFPYNWAKKYYKLLSIYMYFYLYEIQK